jgi:hypothetical protein
MTTLPDPAFGLRGRRRQLDPGASCLNRIGGGLHLRAHP